MSCLGYRLSFNPSNIQVGNRLNELIPYHLELLCVEPKALLLPHDLVRGFSGSWMILIYRLLMLQLHSGWLQLRDLILSGDVWAP